MLLVAVPLASLAPTSSAFGWCTTVGPAGHECRDHVACVGWSWGPGYERCQYGVRDPPPVCDLIYCHWPPMLP